MVILGVDEAGRGPLAGPVAVGAVAVDEGFDLLAAFPGLNDSKKLTEKARERIYASLVQMSEVVRFHVAFRSAADIDGKGIAVCIREGVAECAQKLLPETNGRVLLDGALSAPKEYEQETIIGGDALVPAIMLASVAAKVERDRLMVRLAHDFPVYGFERHKGYGTQAHRNAIKAQGLCAEHRRTFVHV